MLAPSAPHSALMLAARMTLPHFSVSSVKHMNSKSLAAEALRVRFQRAPRYWCCSPREKARPGWRRRLQAGRCSHVFGLLARHTGPLAIMPSADQVPVKSPHSRCTGTSGAVLIAGSAGSALRAVGPPNLQTKTAARLEKKMIERAAWLKQGKVA
jgi:hypothetical protein